VANNHPPPPNIGYGIRDKHGHPFHDNLPHRSICSEHKKLSTSPIHSNPVKSSLTSVSPWSNEMNWSLASHRPLVIISAICPHVPMHKGHDAISGWTHCIKKHSVPSSLRFAVQIRVSFGSLLIGVKRNSQAVQRHAGTRRHDAVPAVTAPIGLVAEADAAEVAFGQGGCCCCRYCCCGEEDGSEEGSERGRRGHCCLGSAVWWKSRFVGRWG
jgi:hypothetical protein